MYNELVLNQSDYLPELGTFIFSSFKTENDIQQRCSKLTDFIFVASGRPLRLILNTF